MSSIYKAHMVNSVHELAPVESVQVHYESRQPQDNEEDEAKAALLHAQRMYESTVRLAKAFSNAPNQCSSPHPAHIHLSGFKNGDIDMLVSVCGLRKGKEKWQLVHCADPTSLDAPVPRQGSADSICSAIQNSNRASDWLRILLHRDGSWHSCSPGPNDRIRKCVAPKKALDEWICPASELGEDDIGLQGLGRKNKMLLACNIARSLLCLLGSPLLQSPWRSQSILVSEIADGSSSSDLNIKPYIYGQLAGCFSEDNTGESEKRRAKWFLLDLALLLWEVFDGKKVTISEEDQNEDEEEFDRIFDALNSRQIKAKESSFIDISCLDIIGNCLRLSGQASQIDARLRTKLYWDIVKPLITSWKGAEPSMQPRMITTDFAQQLSPSHATARKAPSVPHAIHNIALMKVGNANKSSRSFIEQKIRIQQATLSTASPLKAMLTSDDYRGNPPESGGQGLTEPTNPIRPNGSESNHTRAKLYAWPKPCILFDADRGAYRERAGPDGDTEDFIARMTTFATESIVPLPGELAKDIKHNRQKRKIRIAVLDTGIHIDEKDDFLKAAQTRIILKRNFLGNDEMAYDDTYGHGTHIVRLPLQHTPFAEIIVAKISESKELREGEQIINALNWVRTPECNADIIVMSFGIGQRTHLGMAKVIETLVTEHKLIFAAACNGGGNEPRAFPAKADGVFCIHVSDGKGNKTGINPPPLPDNDNFSTLGNVIQSEWQGEQVYISGSSFAAPFAASIAANALEFIRHTLTEANDKPEHFYHYLGMCSLFCCLSDPIDGYSYVKPWKRHLWDEETRLPKTRKALREIARIGHELWIKRTSEQSFDGYPSDVDEENELGLESDHDNM